MVRLTPTTCLATLILLGGCGGSTGPNPGPGSNQVQVVNNSFNPSTLTVPVGTSVQFVWASSAVGHNVTPNGNIIPESPGAPSTQSAPFSFSLVFGLAGTYNYYCTVHGTPTTGMRGSVIVQ